MNGFLISANDRAGLAAQLFEEAGRRGVNVFPAYGLADGTSALMLVGSDDEAGLQAAIEAVGLQATPLEIVVTDVDNRAGAGAEIFRKLAENNVDLRAAVPLGMDGGRVQIGLAASNPDALKRAVAK